jgi:hypothetical protein
LRSIWAMEFPNYLFYILSLSKIFTRTRKDLTLFSSSERNTITTRYPISEYLFSLPVNT